MKINLCCWVVLWTILNFCLIKINATDSKYEDGGNIGQEEMAFGSKRKRQEIIEIGGDGVNKASDSGKKETEKEMELNLGKKEAMRILLNMIKPVFIEFANNIMHYGDDACEILMEENVNEEYEAFKMKIKKEKNKKDMKFNKLMRKMDRNIKNEIKNIKNRVNLKKCLKCVFFFRIMLQIAKLIEENRSKEIQLSDVDSDSKIDKKNKMISYAQKIRESIIEIEKSIKRNNQKEKYEKFMKNYVNKIKINLKNDEKEKNENDMYEDDDDDEEDDEEDEDDEEEEDNEPIKNGQRKKRNRQTNQQRELLINNSDSVDNQPIRRIFNEIDKNLEEVMPIQPINPSEMRLRNMQVRTRSSSKSLNNSGPSQTNSLKNTNSNSSNSRASKPVRANSPNQSHSRNHSSHSNSAAGPLIIQSPRQISNNSESNKNSSNSSHSSHSFNSYTSENFPSKLDSISSQKRQNPQSSNDPNTSKKLKTANQAILPLQQKSKTNSENWLSSNVLKKKRNLRKHKGKEISQKEQSTDILYPKQLLADQLGSDQIQVSDEHSSTVNVKYSKNSENIYQSQKQLIPSYSNSYLGIPLNQFMESPLLQMHSVQNQIDDGPSITQQNVFNKENSHSLNRIEQSPTRFNVPNLPHQMHHPSNPLKEIESSSINHLAKNSIADVNLSIYPKSPTLNDPNNSLSPKSQSKHFPSNESFPIHHQINPSELQKSASGSAKESVEKSPRQLWDLNIPPPPDD